MSNNPLILIVDNICSLLLELKLVQHFEWNILEMTWNEALKLGTWMNKIFILMIEVENSYE